MGSFFVALSTPGNSLWFHVAGLLAIAIGLADVWHFRAFAGGVDMTLIAAGFGALGLTVTLSRQAVRGATPASSARQT